MSTKYVVAAAALATVAITQTEATRFSIDQHKKILPIRRPTPVLLDEEQADWNFNAGIQGGAGGRPQWNVGIGAKWDEEEEQKLRLKKVVNAVKRVNNVVNKAQQVGLLDEEQADWNFNAGIQGGAGGKPQWQVGIGAKWDEEQRWTPPSSTGPYNPTPPFRPFDEEQADWNFNAGIQGGAGGRPQWNVGIGAKWDEEEEQKLRLKKVVKAVKRVNNVVNKAQQVGLLDEEQADWNFNAGIQGGAGGRPQWNVGIGAKWDEEQRWTPPTSTGPFNPTPPFRPFDEEQADWNFNAGIQGGAGGKPQWNVGIGAKWDEEQGFGSKLDNTLDRIGRTIDTWDRVKGLFDEEQAAERMREVLKARQAALKIKKTIAAAAQHKLLDEDEEQGFGSKLDKLLGRIDNTMNTIDRVKGVFN